MCCPSDSWITTVPERLVDVSLFVPHPKYYDHHSFSLSSQYICSFLVDFLKSEHNI